MERRIRERGGGKPKSDVSCLHWALQVTSCSGPPLPENPTGGVCSLTAGELAFPCSGTASTPVLLLVLPLCCLPDYPRRAHSPSSLLWPASVASSDLALAVHITSTSLYLLPSVLSC